MKNLYSIEWQATEDRSYGAIVDKCIPGLLEHVDGLVVSGSFAVPDELGDFDGGDLVRPAGSRRSFYLRNHQTESVIAFKGFEVLSSHLEEAFQRDRLLKLLNRPWSLFENFVYREQKAPLAVSFREAMSEAKISTAYQQVCFENFGFLEEAPIPLAVLKWRSPVVENYKETIAPFFDSRAKDILLPVLEGKGPSVGGGGLGAIIYYYPYLPTRVRFAGRLPESSGKDSLPSKLSAFSNLINIQARMLLNGFLAFGYEDHGIGQCIAPQNVTLRGGICDMGSLKQSPELSIFDYHTLLRATGSILSRTVYELFALQKKDVIYEFDNPSTIHHQLSAIVHERLRNALKDHADRYSLDIEKRVGDYYDPNDESLLESWGLLE